MDTLRGCLVILAFFLVSMVQHGWATTQGGSDTLVVLPTAAQGETPIFSICNSTVTSSLENWAGQILQIANQANCDSGVLTAGTCKVAGVPVDRGCSESMGDIAAALRSIRGQSGLGCLNQVNGNLANALLSAMNQGKFKVCCGQCFGDSTGDTAARSSCAVTLSNPQDISRGTITLNVASNSSTNPQSHCAGRYNGRGLEATLFHELLHTSGVHGFHAHNSAAFNHPVTGVAMDERDVIADPIYGCQNLCYGRSGYNNSTSCLACSLGEPVSGNSAPETTHWSYLNTRLSNAWQLAGAGSPQIPQACMQKWNQGETELGRRLANATTSAKQIKEQFDLLSACSTRLGTQFRSTRTLGPLLDACRPSFLAIQQKCADFARAVTVVRSGASSCATTIYSVHTEAIINMCRQSLRDLQTTLTTAIRFATDKTSVNCNDWFPSTTLCPSIAASGLSTPATPQRCLENQATQ